jgi:hypothetical protein
VSSSSPVALGAPSPLVPDLDALQTDGERGDVEQRAPFSPGREQAPSIRDSISTGLVDGMWPISKA